MLWMWCWPVEMPVSQWTPRGAEAEHGRDVFIPARGRQPTFVRGLRLFGTGITSYRHFYACLNLHALPLVVSLLGALDMAWPGLSLSRVTSPMLCYVVHPAICHQSLAGSSGHVRSQTVSCKKAKGFREGRAGKRAVTIWRTDDGLSSDIGPIRVNNISDAAYREEQGQACAGARRVQSRDVVGTGASCATMALRQNARAGWHVCGQKVAVGASGVR